MRLYLSLLIAFLLAALAHGRQKRKISQIPYIIHPLTVASTLWRCKMNTDLVVAALLHDTLEDTWIKPWVIRILFGKNILSLVESVTSGRDGYVSYNIEAESPAVFVKVADSLSNLSDCMLFPDAVSEVKYRTYLQFMEDAAGSEKTPLLLKIEIQRQLPGFKK